MPEWSSTHLSSFMPWVPLHYGTQKLKGEYYSRRDAELRDRKRFYMYDYFLGECQILHHANGCYAHVYTGTVMTTNGADMTYTVQATTQALSNVPR